MLPYLIAAGLGYLAAMYSQDNENKEEKPKLAGKINKKGMKTIYHGTFFKIDHLSTKKTSKNNRHEYYGEAIYFTDNIDIAIGYSKKIFSEEEGFYKEQLFILEVDENNFVKIDAKGQVIRTLSDKIEELISKKKNIIVKNVRDGNRNSSLTKWMNINETDEDYKYLDGYVLKHNYKRLSPKLKKMILDAKSVGVTIETSVWKTIENKGNEKITKQQAIELDKIGLKVWKLCSRGPDFSNTYIITDNKLLKKAKII